MRGEEEHGGEGWECGQYSDGTGSGRAPPALGTEWVLVTATQALLAVRRRNGGGKNVHGGMGVREEAVDGEEGTGAGLFCCGIIGGAGLGRAPLAWRRSIPPWVEGPGSDLRCSVIVNRDVRSL